jgi:response regulator RpfG family c-di-GMP phosphodiesterase
MFSLHEVSKHDGATICFWEGGLQYFDPELVDSFVENKNSDIKVICSDLHIVCLNVSVHDKG